jgi:hypothetical protein
MNIEVRKQNLFCARTNRSVLPLNWDILLDGRFVGFMPMRELRPIFCMQLDDDEREAVVSFLRETFAPQTIKPPIQPQQPPEPKQDDSEYFDPFEAIEE